MTAVELLDLIRAHGGKVYRARETIVFVLTRNGELATWLQDRGARWLPGSPYPVDRGGPFEWDVLVHMVKVDGEQTIYEAAAQ